MIKSTDLLYSTDDLKELLANKEVIEVELLENELVPLKSIEKLVYARFTLEAKDFKSFEELPTMIQMKVEAKMKLVDDHTFKLETETFSTTEDLLLKGEDENQVVDKVAGKFDFKPSFLAVLYSLVPLSYTKKPNFDKIVVDEDVTIYSEEEYKKLKEKNNPFAVLNPDDFPEE